MGVITFSEPLILEGNTEELSEFYSGQNLIDNYFLYRAPKAKQRGTAVVYVSYIQSAPNPALIGNVAGFFTLSAYAVDRSSITDGWLKRNVPEMLPAILLGMMGVDKSCQGYGLGDQLVFYATKVAHEISQKVGAKVLVVHPIDDSARAFYERFGFVATGSSGQLYLRI